MKKATSEWRWSTRLARVGLVLAIGAIALALIGAYGAGQNWWAKADGVAALRTAFLSAVLALAIAISLLVVHRRHSRFIVRNSLAALVLGGGYVAFVGYYIYLGLSLPPIHDISTDLTDPPQFEKLSLRSDNWSDIPGRGDPDFAGLDAKARWAQIQRSAYGDIRPLHLSTDGARTFALVKRLMAERGWHIAYADAGNGHIEAVDEVSLLRFLDDIVVRIRPDAVGQGVIVDMRSVSRRGRSDFGKNAARIESFFDDLQEAADQ